jgi:hypothetical protein
MIEQNFPFYRKLNNSKSFYKINSNSHFEEIILFGSRKTHFTFEAKQYPEKLKIMDMIALTGNYLESSELEWNSFF